MEGKPLRKIVLLTSLAMLSVLMLAPAAGAQGNDISCPEGSAANAAGNTCTDLATGQQVEPISSNIVFPLQEGSSPCPESSPGNVYTFEGGVCVLNGEPLTQTQQYLQPTPGQLEAAQDFAAGGAVSCDGFGSEFGAQQFYDSTATPEQQAILDPDGNGFACDTPTAVQSTQPEAPVTTTALPNTGGPSLVLLAGALLIGGGLILRDRRS